MISADSPSRVPILRCEAASFWHEFRFFLLLSGEATCVQAAVAVIRSEFLAKSRRRQDLVVSFKDNTTSIVGGTVER